MGPNLRDRLHAARRRAGLTQAELANRLGLDEGTFVDLEAGRRRPSRKIAAVVEAFLVKSDGDRHPDPQ